MQKYLEWEFLDNKAAQFNQNFPFILRDFNNALVSDYLYAESCWICFLK